MEVRRSRGGGREALELSDMVGSFRSLLRHMLETIKKTSAQLG
jgi:hypothetical protein